MNKPDAIERAAQQAATSYMGAVAWPTVILGTVVTLTYLGTLLLVVAGQLPLLAAIVLIAITSYAGYTVLHEAAHGSISGSHRQLRWLNELNLDPNHEDNYRQRNQKMVKFTVTC